MHLDLSVVHARPDGSFVVNGGMYHVPNAGEFAKVWAAIYKHVQGYPDVLRPEPEPGLPEPAQADRGQAGIAAVDARLDEIDRESIRPLRAVAGASASDADKAKLAALEREAAALREERGRHAGVDAMRLCR